MNTRVRPGMTLAERRQARKEILERGMEEARQRVASLFTSATCSGRYVPVDHRRCVGDSPGNGGCLCECHDPKE